MTIFEEFFRLARSHGYRTEGGLQPARWRPPADLYRTGEGWLIKVELAGVKDEDLQVTVSGRRLRIAGERRDRILQHGCECHSLEISYSYFEREFELPADLVDARIVSEHRDGMLLVRVITGGSE